MNVAIIPARGGSKRIPRKNIRPFAGKPIIVHSIEAAQSSGLFARVIVSTDDAEIAEVARFAGAETPFVRPAQLSDDHTGTNAVVKHALSWLIDSGVEVSHACGIYATAPFVSADRLRDGYEKLLESGRSFAFAVTSFDSPVQRALRLRVDGSIEPAYPEHFLSRSQDLESLVHDAGQFYWGRAEAFLNDTVMASPASLAIMVPRYLVQDIDTPEDWKHAEILYEILNRHA